HGRRAAVRSRGPGPPAGCRSEPERHQYGVRRDARDCRRGRLRRPHPLRPCRGMGPRALGLRCGLGRREPNEGSRYDARMLVSLKWLREYVDLPADLDVADLATRLTMASSEVEGIHRTGDWDRSLVTIGQVL